MIVQFGTNLNMAYGIIVLTAQLQYQGVLFVPVVAVVQTSAIVISHSDNKVY